MTTQTINTLRVRKRLARDFARSFAAAVLQNLEVAVQEDTGLTDDEMVEAKKELERIAAKIEASRTYVA